MIVTGHIIGNWNLTGEVNETGEGAIVVPNPPEEATETLEKIGIDDVVYSITGEQEQADWDQADPTAVDYIKNKPTIPAAQVNSDWDAESGVAEILNKPTLSAVATSGSYTDLTDTPTIPAAQVNSDWDAASGVAQILNKPNLSTVATSGSYTDLTNKPTIPAAQVNSDWNAASGVAQILNKPTIPAAQVNSDWNANSGVAQILNKPTIPAAQVNSDWDAASGVAQILNKPTLAAVATSGDASDVSYDNTTSGMTATDVQEAVDELKSNLIRLLPNIKSICIRKQSGTFANGAIGGLNCPSGYDNSSLVFFSAKYQNRSNPILNVGLSSGTPTLTTYTLYGTNARGGTALANGTYEWFELWVKLES